MKRELMEILACPMCKNPELKLLVFESSDVEVESGLINCEKCKRYYPIRKTIPVMLPDDLRKEAEDLAFLRKYQVQIPSQILEEGKPFNLTGSS
ncbi:MAG: Trm112 family protein [Candidatus Thorarchaeota archaeon]